MPGGTQFRDICVNVAYFRQQNCQQNAGSVFSRVWDALEIEKVVFYISKTHIFTNPHLLILGVILGLFGSVL